jgi:hypothetical protein
MDENSHRYNNLPLLNQPLYFKGLGPTELVLALFIIIMSFIGPLILFKTFLYSAFTAPVTIFLVIKFGKKLSLRNNAGDPDFSLSAQTFMQSPKILVDSDRVLHLIKTNEEKRRDRN